MQNQRFSLHPVDLERIFQYSCDSILVTNANGQVIMANPGAEMLLKINHTELIKGNVKDFMAKGYYDRSTSLEAAQTKKMVTGVIKVANGFSFMAISIPLLNETGQVFMVITNSPDQAVIDQLIQVVQKERRPIREYKQAAPDWNKVKPGCAIVAESPAMREILASLAVLAKVDSTVLIYGSSGTGKEVIATQLHQQSPRVDGPFIPVNCAAIPQDLMESEFFGYVKGAFSGACTQGKPGLFEMAHQGTLFLDEIGELPLDLQAKLLRVIETREVQRLGSTALKAVDVRIVAATNQNLAELVEKKTFRQDLYYRLNVIPLVLPDLKARPQDILALAHYFLAEFNQKYGYERYFSPQTEQVFLEYDWPGNVRELRNVVERLVIISPTNQLVLAELTSPANSGPAPGACDAKPGFHYAGTLKAVLQQVEGQYIQQVLAQCQGNVSKAAQELGVHRTALHRKIRLLQNGSQATAGV